MFQFVCMIKRLDFERLGQVLHFLHVRVVVVGAILSLNDSLSFAILGKRNSTLFLFLFQMHSDS